MYVVYKCLWLIFEGHSCIKCWCAWLYVSHTHRKCVCLWVDSLFAGNSFLASFTKCQKGSFTYPCHTVHTFFLKLCVIIIKKKKLKKVEDKSSVSSVYHFPIAPGWGGIIWSCHFTFRKQCGQLIVFREPHWGYKHDRGCLSSSPSSLILDYYYCHCYYRQMCGKDMNAFQTVKVISVI